MRIEIPLWKEAPFLRLLVPFIGGIIIHSYCHNPPVFYWGLIALSAALLFIFPRIPLKWQFSAYAIPGICLNILLLALGGLFAVQKNPFATRQTIAGLISQHNLYSVVLLEPLQEKKSTWKAIARINNVTTVKQRIDPATDIIIYFRKDGQPLPVQYGTRLVFSTSPELIKNEESTGFDYVRYCALKNIHCQVFLRSGEYIVLNSPEANLVSRFVYRMQSWVVNHIKTFIPGHKEAGLALALIIGYRNDLDKGLIQSYSNTGVVHVIAISGLHLGLIYSILRFLCRPFKAKPGWRWLSPVLILSGLWLFSLLAGASPSVLRSAVMFSFIVAGEAMSRRSSLINNIAASAFFLLCFEPYWLWDLGFILSYGALLSIIVFMKPIYHLLYFKNKLADAVWKTNAVTLAAQVLTTPVIVYHFKQFPTLFLLTNFIAIPASGIILTGEIVLCIVYFSDSVSSVLGLVLSHLIQLLNRFIVYVDRLPFSTLGGLDISFSQVLLIYVIITLGSRWLFLRLLK